jgi:heme-degrading monooxygenase HmoA
MYIRAITLPVQPSKTDEAIRLFRESVAPIFQQQKGFKGGYLVGDRKTGKAMSFSLWETEADASVMDSSGAYQKWTALLAPYLVGPTVREQDEVYLEF